MLKLFALLAVAVTALAVSAVAGAQRQGHITFVAHLSAEAEIPGCPAGVESGARGVAIIHIDEDTGEIRYRVVGVNLPGTIADSPGGHIHVGSANEAGPIAPGGELQLTGKENGLVAAGSATNPALAAAILANPSNYYVNVHTTACPQGAIRGQLA